MSCRNQRMKCLDYVVGTEGQTTDDGWHRTSGQNHIRGLTFGTDRCTKKPASLTGLTGFPQYNNSCCKYYRPYGAM
jgi:hypothetical protein